MTERLMLLDTAALYFRAYYGMPDTVRGPDGTPVNAVRGLLDIVARLVAEFEPTHLVACWDDAWRPAWRVALIPSYKAHRVARTGPDGVDIEEVPESLVAQVPVIRTVLAALGIAVVGAAGYEADDVIASLATQASMPVDIVTSDRDLFQLIDDTSGVRVISTARGMSKLELVTDAVVASRYGVTAAQYADFAVLRGDPSDGLPGVSGIGEKTAAGLLAEFGSLEAIVRAAGGGGGAGVAAGVAAGSGGGGSGADGAGEPGPRLSAAVRAKVLAASGYLDVAPRVVAVARDLALGDLDARIRPLDDARLEAARELAERWGLGGAVDRALAALSSRHSEPNGPSEL